MIFAKGKSIVGSTCAHIFTDGVFVQIIPMIYKIKGWHNIRQDKSGRWGFKRNIYGKFTQADWL